MACWMLDAAGIHDMLGVSSIMKTCHDDMILDVRCGWHV
jgi:hypothetical protein